ncbi:hypothetical protein [Desulfovibrio sp. TomC]|uniref:hypothetical protein n=1 Tax=Desulfovibrio sp. TomC TaxID=1562888 RepID=UPI0005BB3AB7|nr:hypothetical protein [Desulfovibrio sp. TomC]
MNLTLRPAAIAAVLLATGLGLAGCGKSYVNSNIIDQSQAKARLAQDKELCKAEANSDVPPTFGLDRFEYDPTIEAQATRWVANVAEDDANQDAFTKCMRMRGWRYR